MSETFGVYILFHEHKVVYIGKSKNVYDRVSKHRQNGRPFDFSAIINLPENDCGWVEESLIKAFAPIQNKHHREVDQTEENKTVDQKQFEYLLERINKIHLHNISSKAIPEILSKERAIRYAKEKYGQLGRNLRKAINSAEIKSIKITQGSRTSKHIKRADIDKWMTKIIEGAV